MRYLHIVFVLWLSFSLPLASAQEEPWYETALVGIETGPTGAQFGSDGRDVGYVARFDGRECVRRAVEANCDYVVIWARDGVYTYYDSEWQPKAPGLGDRDILEESVSEARKTGIPVIAYCVLQYPTQALHQHPDWRMQDAQGQPIERVCFNSPYLDHVKNLLREMKTYGIDGFHLDMVDQGFGPPYGCWCPHCQAKFKAQHEHEMPREITWDAAWDKVLEFRYQSSATFEQALVDFVKAQWPETSVDFNYHGNPPFSFEVGQRPVQHGITGDFITGETGQWAFSSLGVGFNAAFYRATATNRRVQVVMQRGVRHYHDQTTRPLNDMRWEALTLLAHGAFVTMVDKTAYDGWLDPVFYERLKVIFEEAKAKQAHFGQRPHADVGIYFSHRTRDWLGRENAPAAWQGVLGAHKALVYDHIPWGIVLDEHASLERLKSFPVILLANIGILEDREVDNLTAYVTGGGRLIVTGASGLYDRFGGKRETTKLQKLIGGNAVRVLSSKDNHIRFSKEDASYPLAHGLPEDWPFLVQGSAVVYRPSSARPLGDLMEPHRTVAQRDGKEGTRFPMSADTTKIVGPAALLHQVGQGQVLTLACSPGEAATSEFHISEARQLLPKAVKALLPNPLVGIEAPSYVEAVVTRDEKVLRIHFIARLEPSAALPPTGRPAVLPTMMEDAPLFRAQVRVRDALKGAAAVNPKTQVSIEGQTISLLVEDVHDVLVVDLE